MTIAKHPAANSKRIPPGSFLGKLKKRGVIAALATALGGGWLVYEIVHFILIDHYHLPETLKDIVIVSTLCVLFCTVTWRWFRGEKKKRRIKWEYVLLLVFVLVGAYLDGTYLLHLGSESAEPSGTIFQERAWKNSVAVLPFINMSADEKQEYFCDGLTEELITKLSQIQELKVPARTSAFVFKGKSVDIREVGQRLRVENVIEGSVRKTGSRIRISAQLINVSDGYHLWSETYDREVDDIFAVQDEIARSVAGKLRVTLLREEEASAETRNTEAHNAFLMARYFYSLQTRENLAKAVGYFKEAITLDPAYARAWAGLGAAHAFQAGVGYVLPKKGYDQARAAVKRALALEKNLAYAYRIRGWIEMSYDWDWAGANASYQKAMSLEPGAGQIEAAQLAVALGRFDQGVALARRTEELDPIGVQPVNTLALAYWYAGRTEEAIAAYRKILEIIPEYEAVHAWLGLVRLTQSDPQGALAELDLAKDPFWRLPGLAMAYHSLAKKTESDAALAEFIEKYQDGGAYNIAQVYAFRGEADRAFQWLERAYAQHDGGMFLVKVDPLLGSLRNDPRYKALLKKMRLPTR